MKFYSWSGRAAVLVLLAMTAALWAGVGSAAQMGLKLEIRRHLFYPSELTVPVNQKIKLTIRNTDATPEEFESYDLNRKKMIPGHSEAVIYIGPLEAGDYTFFGGFNPKTAQGLVHVE